MLILQISQAQIIELMKSVEGLRGAIVVLSKHQLGAFPQLQLDFLSAECLARLNSWPSPKFLTCTKIC